MDDSPIEPLRPVDLDAAVEPPVTTSVRTRPAPTPTTDAPPPGLTLGARATRAELEEPIPMPAASTRVAGVHDATQHGEPIAAAIERAHVSDVSDRAQQLGGAAASAASGQSTPAPAATTEPHGDRTRVDPLEPVTEVLDDRPRG